MTEDRSGNGIKMHFRIKHPTWFDLLYNPNSGYLPSRHITGRKGEQRCHGYRCKKIYETIDDAWREVTIAFGMRGVVLFPYRCMGYWRPTHRVRGCQKWHVSRSCPALPSTGGQLGP